MRVDMRHARHISLAIALAMPAWAWAAESCPKEQAIAAESVAPFIESWAGLQRAYKQYGHCDDGAAGEGFSQTVARLMTGSASPLRQLEVLSQTDPAFRSFVIRHVDATLSTEQLSTIESRLPDVCPAAGTALCDEIARALISARREQETRPRGP